MGDKSAIEWTDSTWNPIRGTKGMWTCTKVSPGCTHCYAERLNMSKRHGSGPAYVVGADTVRLDERVLLDPTRWRQPRKIFVCSMTDLFGEWVPDEWINQVWTVMGQARHHTFQVLTKRPERIPDFQAAYRGGGFLGNVWLGVSAEDQQRADERIPLLLQIPAAVRFLSLEPLLGPIDLRGCPSCGNFYRNGHDCETDNPTTPIDWVIVGGESGGSPERALVYQRPSDPMQPYRFCVRPQAEEWVRSIRDQCVAAGVPFFFKQWGGRTPKSGGRMLDGRTWDAFPSQGKIA